MASRIKGFLPQIPRSASLVEVKLPATTKPHVVVTTTDCDGCGHISPVNEHGFCSKCWRGPSVEIA